MLFYRRFRFLDERGSAIVLVLAILFLITAYVTFLWVGVRRVAQVTLAESRGLTALSIAENNLAEYVRTIDSYQYPLNSISELPDDSLELVREGYNPVIKLNASGEYFGAEGGNAILVTMRHLSPEKPMLPDWGAFRTMLKSSDEACSSWQEEVGRPVVKGLRSRRSCKRFLGEISESVYIAGNLNLAHPIKFRNMSERKIYVLVVGALELKGGFSVQNCSNVIIEIITAGDVTVDSFGMTNVNNVTVLLHSTSGAVEVTSIDERIANCSESRGPFSLAVEAKEGIKLGANPVTHSSLGACRYTRKSPLWKKFKVIGDV